MRHCIKSGLYVFDVLDKIRQSARLLITSPRLKGVKSHMKPTQIKAIRAAKHENTATFGARFCRSGRSVEDWEQGRRNPDPLAERILITLAAEVEAEKKTKAK